MPRDPLARLRARVAVVCLCSAALVCAGLWVGARDREIAAAAPARELAPRTVAAAAAASIAGDGAARGTALRVGGRASARAYLRFRLPVAAARGRQRAQLALSALPGSRGGIVVRVALGGRWRGSSLAASPAPRLGRVVARRTRVRAGDRLALDVTRALTGGRTIDLAIVRRRRGDAVRLAGRRAATRLTPRLAVAAGADAAAPVVAAAGDMVCDPHSPNRRNRVPGTCLDRATSDLLVGRDLRAVLTLGDNQYERGALTAFRGTYDRTWGRVKDITRPSVGNHEYLTRGAAGYFDYFNGSGRREGRAGRRGEGWYSYDVGAWHVVALNSVCDEVGGCGPGSPQLEWLKADLAASRARCTLAYWHHPRFSSGQEHSNVRTDGFWRTLYDAGADVVLSGHAHDYERFDPQTPDARRDDERGLREFVVGTGGKNNYPFRRTEANSVVRDATTSGVLLLSLRPTGYDWRFAAVAGGRLRDAGSGRCH